jgi:hypothetical protein
MLKRLCFVFFAALVGFAAYQPTEASLSDQEGLEAFTNNTCVMCHSRHSSTSPVTNRYLEWHMSAHKTGAVSCDKCHGGDALAKDKGAAHAGVRPATDTESRLHQTRIADTCGACHKEVTAGFTQSTHHTKLKASGLGPSCSTCHAHMGSAVVNFPSETAALCAQCHDAQNGPLPRRPEIPTRAAQVMEALERADGMVIWANRLIEAAPDRKADVSAEKAEMQAVRAAVLEAKMSWHTFSMDAAQKKADEAYDTAVKVKDKLMRKLGFAK